MSRAYSKPTIIYEDFSLSTSVANCEEKTNLPSYLACGLPLPGVGTVFVDGNTGCKLKPSALDPKAPSDQIYNGVCYHVPYEHNNLFCS
jgi:hypothetical protein